MRRDPGQLGKLIESEEDLTTQVPHHVAKGTSVFIKDGPRVKEALVPRSSLIKIPHCHSQMSVCW
jgi:hypothetical protein